ncbi:transposable element Tcb1 transposase [Trichonephila clavipes]|nr:transposable element Tcb1 transposase [Trichonephila clavipes]
MKEGCRRQNGMKLSLLTSHASVCNTTLVGFESGYTVERGCFTAALCTSTLALHRVLWIMRDHTWHASSKGSLSIELLPWPAHSPDLSPIKNMWFMVAQRLTQITPPAATPDQLWNVWKLLGLLYPKNTSKVSLNQCRGVWQL